MSGPKSYNPPPRMFSVSKFDGKLNNVYRLQAQIEACLEELADCRIDDRERHISFNCDSALKNVKKQAKLLLAHVSLGNASQVNEAEYRRITRRLEDISGNLTDFKTRLEQTRSGFEEKRKDYQAYLQYEQMHYQCLERFATARDKTVDMVKSLKTEQSTDKLTKSLTSLKVDTKLAKFEFDFRNKLQHKTGELREVTQNAFENLNDARILLGDKISELIGGFQLTVASQMVDDDATSNATEKDKTNQAIEGVHAEINNLENLALCEKYSLQLDRILAADNRQQAYLCHDLCDEIRRVVKTGKLRVAIPDQLSRIKSEHICESLKLQEQQIRERATTLLNAENVKDFELETLTRDIDSLAAQNRRIIEEDRIVAREHNEMKEAVIAGLRDKGYDIVEDSRVIDFETDKEFLLTTKGKNNFLNVRFSEDGGMVYNFMMAENKDDLSKRELDRKVDDMRVACNDFLSVKSDLDIPLSIRTEKPVEASSLLSVPGKYQNQIKSYIKKSDKQEEQQKKRMEL